MTDRGMAAAARTFRNTGLDVVRFNFLYKERKSGRPDPMPLLQKTIRAVVDDVRARLSPQRLYMGGRCDGRTRGVDARIRRVRE